MSAADRFEDHRGVIQDLLGGLLPEPLGGPIDAVTEIVTRGGKIRGNHYHEKTTQWTYVVRGRLLIATRLGGQDGVQENVYDPGMMACEEPGTAHAWKALHDTVVLVFTRGPRAGAAYESDTTRLEVPLLQ